MKILVTGANGFIGRKVSSRLISLGHQVFGLSLSNSPDQSLAFKGYYQQDISRSFSLNKHFDFVIHMAAYNITNVGAKDSGMYTAINIEGTRNVLKAVSTEKFIYLSTSKVYKSDGVLLDEDSPLMPQGAYEQSKLKAEDLCREILKQEELVILRSVNVIGWGQAPKAVLPVFFQKAKTNQPLDIINGTNTTMQYVYVEDLVDALESVIHQDRVSGIFNIANEETVSLDKLARSIITITHSSSILNVSNNSTGPVFSKVKSDKAFRQLGWKAKTGISKILEFYEESYARAQ